MEITLSTLLAHTQLSRVNNPSSAEKNSPPIEGGIFIDPNADIYQQVASYFQQLGYEIPEQTSRTDTVSNQLEPLLQQVKNLIRDIKRSGDNTSRILLSISDELLSSASGTTKHLLRKHAVDDGRSHIGQISDMIKNINEGYQKDFGKIIKTTTEFMQAVNTALGKMSNHMEAGDNGKIKLFKDRIKNDLNSELKKFFKEKLHPNTFFSSTASDDNTNYYYMNILEEVYRNPSNNKKYNEKNVINYLEPLYSIDFSEQAFGFWEKKLEGQGFIVLKSSNKINIYPDLDAVRNIYTGVHNYGNTGKPQVQDLVQVYQSMQTGLDAQKNAVNNSVSRLLETFRQDNSHFDTLTQLLVQLIKDLNQYNNSLISI
ncbi:IpaD/SipD/SspD family type III secretion system needle tip protein [Providencia stuartii]|nr:IpaD/SipD/SspD family type III secretion system needle tip protein [Providencia stuartii]